MSYTLIICLLSLALTNCISTMETKSWAQKTLDQLTLEQKIGQLFMVPAISDTAQNPNFLEHTPYAMDHAYVKKLIADYHVGGVIFLGLSTAAKQVKLTQKFQKLSAIPLLIGQDLEWGLQMRLRDGIQFPYALTLGAIQDNELLYQLGQEIGEQCAAIGVHINFAPVVDINTNPQNPVINHRSFGDNPENVCQKAAAFAKGLHNAEIIACAKHFPGHGDAQVDSHFDLPVIQHDSDRLHAVELQPFKHLIAKNIPAIMTAHIALPALQKDITRNRPASLSYDLVTKLLKQELGFSGLVITDGLGMQGVTKHYEPGYVELNALLAGNDILLCPVDVPRAIELIMQTIKTGAFSEKELDTRVLKILSAKEWVLSKYEEYEPYMLDTLYNKKTYTLKRILYERAVTVVRDTFNTIPLKNQPSDIIEIGCKKSQPFAQALHKVYPHLKDKEHTSKHRKPFTDDLIIIAIYKMNKSAQERYGITKQIQNVIESLHWYHPNLMLVLFGNPYSCAFFNDIPGIICAYQNDVDAQQAAAKILLGRIQAKGKLPVSL